MWVWLVAAGAGGHSVSPVTDCWGSCRLRSQSRTRPQPRHTRPGLTAVGASRLLWLWIWDPSYAQTLSVAEYGKSAIFKVKYECRLSKLFGEPRELQLYVSWTFELLSRYLFFSWVTIIFGTSREEVEVCNEKCCSMQFAVHIRASNEGLQRFHNHGEGSYQGDLREDLKKDATLIIFTLSKMLGPRFTQLVGCPQTLVHTAFIYYGLMPT